MTKEMTGIKCRNINFTINAFILAVVIPNAIAITTHRKNYIFRSFWDRDDCFATLSGLLSKYKDVPLRDTITFDERLRASSIPVLMQSSPDVCSGLN